MISIALAAALTLAADSKTSNTQKDAIKSAIVVDKAPADGGSTATAPAAATDRPPQPDASKMTFGPEAVKEIVTFYQPQIQNCYEETLATKDKAPEGVLKTKWIIDPNGVVTKAEIVKKGTTLKEPKLHDCVVTVLSSMTFPKPPNGKKQPIEFPFNLKAVH